MGEEKAKAGKEENDLICKLLIEDIRQTVALLGMKLVDKGNGLMGFERVKELEKK